MDGKTLSRDLAALLTEDPDTSGYLDQKATYTYLWRAAVEMSRRLLYPRGTDTVTTVSGQVDQYKLASDFLCLYLRDSNDEFFVRYYNNSAYSNLRMKDESDIFENYTTNSQAIPGGFAITDYRQSIPRVMGTATATGATSAGECTLTDSAASFASTASAGDTIHNTTDGSTGYVLSVTSNTAVVTALFGGTGNEWTSADAYTLVPQKRYQLTFDAPPSTTGHTVTVPYVKRPSPVYSHYGSYPFPADLTMALVNYAAWLYKYRDSQPSFGDRYFSIFDRDVRRAATQLSASLTRKRLSVSMKA